MGLNWLSLGKFASKDEEERWVGFDIGVAAEKVMDAESEG